MNTILTLGILENTKIQLNGIKKILSVVMILAVKAITHKLTDVENLI